MNYPIFLKKIVHNSKYALLKSMNTKSLFLDWSKTEHNFGDILNPILVSHLTDFNIINTNSRYTYYPHLLAIGSILDRATSLSSVWGSGYISKDSCFISKPKKIYAVRGPLTRQKLINQGVECPEVYGDPALLMSRFYPSHKQKRFKLGILPHYSDKLNTFLPMIKDDQVKVIDIQNPNPLKVIDEICSCECLASSSLHGLIIADSYQIPSVWLKFSNKLVGGSFKFHDYFQSIGSNVKDPCVVTSDIDPEALIDSCRLRDLDIDLELLIDNFPTSL